MPIPPIPRKKMFCMSFCANISDSSLNALQNYNFFARYARVSAKKNQKNCSLSLCTLTAGAGTAKPKCSISNVEATWLQRGGNVTLTWVQECSVFPSTNLFPRYFPCSFAQKICTYGKKAVILQAYCDAKDFETYIGGCSVRNIMQRTRASTREH